MNILLLGNGYDLNYKLPTSYRNFLLTIDFLTKHNLENIHTVGDVFGNPDLNTQDKFIKESYDAYKEIYDSIALDTKTIQDIAKQAKTNIWFSYFMKSFNREAGWIDFEREIAFVVDCFQSFFSKADVKFIPGRACDKNGTKYIIMKMFNFFISEEKHSENAWLTNVKKVSPDYTIEYPLASGDYIINKEKIIENLNSALNEFVNILKIYLQCFIDKTAEKLVEQSTIIQLQALRNTDVVITFNYTNIYEFFDPNTRIFHIHGNVNDKIVLGINPDKNDEKENIDTSFIAFKKYYQRTFWGTDTSYLRWLRDLLDGGGGDGDVHLLVMGHSLDITDEDIIGDLFGLASEITVLYHNEYAKSQYIRNLVKIFGKNKFDQIRDEQRLSFLPLNMDFTEFIKRRARYSTTRYESEMLKYL